MGRNGGTLLAPRLLRIAPAVCALSLLFSCNASESPLGQSSSSDVGPLLVGANGGGVSVDPPKHWAGKFSAYFGSFTLCSSQPGTDIQIRNVTFPSDTPAGTMAWVRRVSKDALRGETRNGLAAYNPVAFGLGVPPSFDQPYSQASPPGEYRPFAGSIGIRESCDEVRDTTNALNGGGTPRSGFTELLIVVPSSEAGGEVDGFDMSYTAGGNSYSTRVSWQMIVCDTAHTREHCA